MFLIISDITLNYIGDNTIMHIKDDNIYFCNFMYKPYYISQCVYSTIYTYYVSRSDIHIGFLYISLKYHVFPRTIPLKIEDGLIKTYTLKATPRSSD